MPRPGRNCSICAHARRSQIERDWLAGQPRRQIAERFEVSYRQLCNHWQRGHVAKDVIAAKIQKRSEKAGSAILNSIDEYRQRIDRALNRTEEILATCGTDDVGKLLATIREQNSTIREATRLVELGGRITGELDQAKFSVYVLPQWVEIRDIIFEALDCFPEARLAVLNAVSDKLAARAIQALPPPDEDSPAVEVEAETLPES